MTDNPLVFAIDFDGTVCENKYPEIGKPIQPIIDFCKTMKADGHKLILWTCREGEMLHSATSWCFWQGLIFDAINTNLPERIEQYGTDPRKIGADFYVDDRNILIKELM